MKDLGILKYFLGIKVARSGDGLFLCQHKYTLDIISEAGLLGAQPAAFPIEQNHALSLAKEAELADPASYRRLVGGLIYISFTRLDLACTVHILSQFMQIPREEHRDAALRVDLDICLERVCDPGLDLSLDLMSGYDPRPTCDLEPDLDVRLG
ncbi:transmembrane signal receptor [Lithospermum erythrorhizon]|uniref:Transmembrane signal receptor n=1 Tax=Lithospermum erythrorhizon TaxID=34254 RepID=A0AAV3REB1_LITER